MSGGTKAGTMESDSVRDGTVREMRCRVRGVVQGVGFRPFVWRLADRLGVRGWVCNDSGGVRLRLVAPEEALTRFKRALCAEAPPGARVDGIENLDTDESPLPPLPGNGFAILPSDSHGSIEAELPPDLAVCGECLREMRDPSGRRHRYPFLSCAHCGPRFSIIENIPYDRASTTMRDFAMCPACRAEYEDPSDRRFHAQPIACPDCGPWLTYCDRSGRELCERDQALLHAVECLRAGAVVAVKGLGGFHLICDPGCKRAVAALRERKGREEKPFAMMAPSLTAAYRLCVLSAEEEIELTSVRAPIVLARRRENSGYAINARVAPDSILHGLMLPYAPLHHLIMDLWQGFLVATSGNLSEEPICIDNADAIRRLGGIADGFLLHNRPIARPLDDSVVRVMRGNPVVLRRARGYAPGVVPAPENLPPLVAVGGHLKNTVAVTAGGRLFPGPHIGDLSTREARAVFEEGVAVLSRLYAVEAQAVACDRHPDYASTLWAESQGLPVVRVQHHHAHVLSGISDNRIRGPVLGVAWDGSGYGPDGTVWGGEWLVCEAGRPSYRRVACLREFRLPGGEAAIRRPALTAIGLLWEVFREDAFRNLPGLARFDLCEREERILERMLTRRLRTPGTTSVGRLFDGVAALLGLGAEISFEGQAAMRLEYLADRSEDDRSYSFDFLKAARNGDPELYPEVVVDWVPMMREILADIEAGTPPARIARRFHNTLAGMITAVASKNPGLPVMLTGGCFQNKLLYETVSAFLENESIAVYGHRDIPPNDGGLSSGQILAAAARLPVS